MLLAAAAGAGEEPDTREKQAELEALRAEIQAVQQQLARDLGQRDQLTGELRMAERELAAAASALREVNIQIDFKQDRLSELEAEQRARRARLGSEREALATQVRAAYLAGREEKMKLLLNQQDPATFGRVLVYYDYLNRERTERIETVLEQLTRLVELESEIAAEVADLARVREQRAELLQRLEASRDQRATVLASLEQSIRTRNAELDALQRDEKALADLVASLLDVFADIPDRLSDQVAFNSLRGKLSWPADGRLVARFGQPRAEGRMRWNGMMIAAEPGTPVRAVSHGRVAYADWLPHYGLLLILEHGDGYLSLYGHNQTLYKEVGDWVVPGEIVAAMGDSGGQQRAALYFEIRHNKDVQDPARWLSSRR
ncbi:MAG: peptidoglycan DD-metalloendopeptidase family protein [Gammaproteobacteria bacterium]|nr:peptidoglycan DD-metalloendopeptidase family protein [Gammaproteobacteria bacterium]